MSIFLGVDGGGTKTGYALLDIEGQIRARHVGPSISHLAHGIEHAARVLNEGIDAVVAKAALTMSDVRFAFLGLPAYGEDTKAIAALDALPSARLSAGTYRCGNDMICSWAGALGCQDGISVIAGTGSLAYGEYSGRQARCGGWGETIGDEGSAYWIARAGMNLFSRMSDGRAPLGPLYELVRQRLELIDDLDLCAHVYGVQANTRSAFAQFAPLVHEAAIAGDSQAESIFRRAADELVECVVATRSTLAVPNEIVLPVSHSGGVFEGSSLLLDAFRSSLNASGRSFDYRAPLHAPDLGAALYAARLSGAALSDAALRHRHASPTP